MILKSIHKTLSKLSFFKGIKLFSVFYFTLLLIHILLKNLNLDPFVASLISKPWFLLFLIVFYIINAEFKNTRDFRLMLLALFAFWLGDMALIFVENKLFFNLGILFFIIGKLIYSMRFANTKDFRLIKIIPFMLLCFFYMIFLMNFLHLSLGDYFFPVLFYLFLSMIVGLFAFLRQYEVDRRSFLLVFIGVLCSFVSDSVSIIQAFYNQLFITKFNVVMIFYSLSQYLIVLGILFEKKNMDNDFKNDNTI